MASIASINDIPFVEEPLEENPLTPEEKLIEEFKGKFLIEASRKFKGMDYSEKTERLCLAAVGRIGWLIEYVPTKFLTEEICLTAIKGCPSAIWLVPYDKRTPSICREVLMNYPEGIKYMQNQTPEYCFLALEKDPTTLMYLRKQRREYCEYAIQKEPECLLLCKLKTPKLIKMAIEKDSRLIQVLSPHEQKENICRLSVRKNWKNLHYVEKQSVYVSKLALYQNIKAVKYLKNPGHFGLFLAELLGRPEVYDNPFTHVGSFLYARVKSPREIHLQEILNRENTNAFESESFHSEDYEIER